MSYLLCMSMAIMKLLCSNKALSMMISIEMTMASVVMIWLVNTINYSQIYLYIMFFCLSVSEGILGLTIIVSIMTHSSKAHSNMIISKV